MTRRQTGQVFKLGDGTWAYRYRSRDGRRPQQGGYQSKGAARSALNEQLDRDQAGIRAPITLAQLIHQYLEQYTAAPGTVERLTWELSKAAPLGRLPVDRIHTHDIEAWRARLPEQQRYHCYAALRQVLNAGVRWRYLATSPTAGVANPMPATPEIHPFTRAELAAITAELAAEDALFVWFLADTGLRPGEAIALERRDLDVRRRVVHVNRSYSRGVLAALPKDGGRRSVPLRQHIRARLAGQPRRIDARLLFPAPRGGYRDLHNWRARQWKDALEAAGVPYRQPYALRHTYATESLAATIPLFTLAQRMGTSLRMIQQTYGHLAQDAAEHELALLDAWDARAAENPGPTGRGLDVEGQA